HEKRPAGRCCRPISHKTGGGRCTRAGWRHRVGRTPRETHGPPEISPRRPPRSGPECTNKHPACAAKLYHTNDRGAGERTTKTPDRSAPAAGAGERWRRGSRARRAAPEIGALAHRPAIRVPVVSPLPGDGLPRRGFGVHVDVTLEGVPEPRPRPAQKRFHRLGGQGHHV